MEYCVEEFGWDGARLLRPADRAFRELDDESEFACSRPTLLRRGGFRGLLEGPRTAQSRGEGRARLGGSLRDTDVVVWPAKEVSST